MSDITLSIVKVKMVDVIWDKILPFVELAMEYSNGETSPDIIKENVKDDKMILVLVHMDNEIVAVFSLEIIKFETGKNVLHISTAGGSHMDKWIDQADELFNTLAKKYDCSEVYVIGRPGWKRQLSKMNYKVLHTVLSRKVY